MAFIPLIPDNTIFTPENSNFFMRTAMVSVSVLFLGYFFYSRKFRDEVSEKTGALIRNPIVISVLSFICIFIISSIFAVDKYVAFWGNIERMEGAVGFVYFFSFFVFSLLVFERKDWVWFFRLSLFTALVLLLKEFFQFFSGAVRPDSLLNNPSFLAAYLLFPMASSIIVFGDTENKFWRIFSVGIFFLAIWGIFLTQTRGTILGMVVGLVAIAVYCVFTGKNIYYKKLNLRKTAVILLIILAMFSGVFVLTRKSEVWQKVPGLARVARITEEDVTTKTRLLNINLSLNAVNPNQNGLKKLLLGWGPDNFRLAYGKYFNPKQFDYEKAWFDRAHNQALDLLVMAGVLGLLAYLAIYFFLFKVLFRNKEFSFRNIGLVFFGVAFFAHLLFLFNQITTSIPFFAVLAFSASLATSGGVVKTENNKKEIYTKIFFPLLVLFLVCVFFRNDLPAFAQMKEYGSLREKSYVQDLTIKIDSVFRPFTVAQNKIRRDFLSFTLDNYDPNNEAVVALAQEAIKESEDYAKRRPLDLQYLSFLGSTYTNQSKKLNDPELLQKGENYLREILDRAPSRSDVRYNLALNLFFQNRYEESLSDFEDIFNNDPGYISEEKDFLGVYGFFLKHFYEIRDKENLIKVANRLKKNNYAGSAVLDEIIGIINRTNTWPPINFRN